MASSQNYPHLLIATPSSSEGATLRGEGAWRRASPSNLDQEMFGQAPDTPIPPNVSPLYSESSSARTLPTHASLLSPYDNLRASSRSQLSLPGSPTTMTSAAPTISHPVQSGCPSGTQHEYPPANTAHHNEAQSEDIGPASDGRSLGLWGRLWKFFRVPFRALLCIRPERPAHTPSVSLENLPFRIPPVVLDLTAIQQRLPPQKTLADGEKPISTRTQNDSDTQTPSSPGFLDAFEGPSPQRDRHNAPVTPSDGSDKEGARIEAIIGTPGQQPSADLDPPMPATSPNSAPKCRIEPPSFTETLYTEVSGHYPTTCSNPPHL